MSIKFSEAKDLAKKEFDKSKRKMSNYSVEYDDSWVFAEGTPQTEMALNPQMFAVSKEDGKISYIPMMLDKFFNYYKKPIVRIIKLKNSSNIS